MTPKLKTNIAYALYMLITAPIRYLIVLSNNDTVSWLLIACFMGIDFLVFGLIKKKDGTD